jgi:hypothetical protein
VVYTSPLELSVQKYTCVPILYFPCGGSMDSRGTNTEPITAHPCSVAQTKNMNIFKVFFWYKKLTP